MSFSTLYGIKGNFTARCLKNYPNSWLFAPIVMQVLPDKYMHDLIQTPYGYTKSVFGMDGDVIWRMTDELTRDYGIPSDRICWSVANQYVFFTKDKEVIAKGIRDFAAGNGKYAPDDEGRGMLQEEHIRARFEEIADDIEALDENEYPYFVLKGTSVDDSVETWFAEWDEEKEEAYECPLSKWDEHVATFAVIENGDISKYISNLDVCGKEGRKRSD